MSFHFCYFAHFCFFLCILTNPAPEIPLLLFINIRQFPCFETMGRFSLSPCEKECALAHSRAEARLLQQPSTTAPSAHPRGAFIIVWKRSFQYDEKTAVHSCTAVSLFLILFCVFTAAVLENTSDRHRCSVACVRNLDTGCFRAGMDDLSVTDINRNMSGIAN